MRRALGVRARVTLAFTVVMAVMLGVAGVAIHHGVGDQLTDATDETLETRAAALASIIVARGRVDPDVGVGLDDPGETFSEVIAPGERLLAASAGLPAGPLLGPEERADATEGATIVLEGVEIEDDTPDHEIDVDALEDTEPEAFEDDRARVLARELTLGGERLAIVVGATLEDREDALRAVRRVLIVALPLALLAAALAGWFAVGAALRPVERMRRRAAGISEASLGDRLPLPAADDELRRLGVTLNAMLARLEEALERERAFVADASHELRTPLAVLRTELELALRGGRSEAELRDALRSAHEETEHLSTLADNLLLMARADQGELTLDQHAFDVGELQARVARRFAATAQALGREVRVTVPGDVVARGDELRLEQALGALVDNALRHGDGPVELAAARAAGQLELTVADRGAGIDPAFAQRAFERFTRADAARTTPGTGLGLAIARTIARGHGGDAELRPRPGGGTVAVLRLPA